MRHFCKRCCGYGGAGPDEGEPGLGDEGESEEAPNPLKAPPVPSDVRTVANERRRGAGSVEGTNTQTGDGRRLVLGFDAGCVTCSELAKKIEETVGDRLEVFNLRHPQVEVWRGRALGEDAPWAPTLFEVGSDSIKAWTGRRMGLVLAGKLGIFATWRVMQTLGEVQDKLAGADIRQKTSAGALSRGKFLKGASGTVLAFGLFSGSAVPAFANSKQKAVKAGEQAERAIFLMERHMSIERNGTLSLNEESLKDDMQAGLGEDIDRSVFTALKQNLADTNAKLLEGKAPGQFSKAKAENLFPTVSQLATERKLVSSRAGCPGINWVQYFWWGRRSWIDNCNTNKLVRRLIGGAGIFAIIACFPVGGAPAGMASALVGLGGYAIDNTNRGRGVYINYILRLVAVRVRSQ